MHIFAKAASSIPWIYFCWASKAKISGGYPPDTVSRGGNRRGRRTPGIGEGNCMMIWVVLMCPSPSIYLNIRSFSGTNYWLLLGSGWEPGLSLYPLGSGLELPEVVQPSGRLKYPCAGVSSRSCPLTKSGWQLKGYGKQATPFMDKFMLHFLHQQVQLPLELFPFGISCCICIFERYDP